VWSIIKNGIRGQYHVLSKKYLPFYLAEAAYKYNRRGKGEKAAAFNETIGNAVSDPKCQVRYKPKGNVRKIVYGEEVPKRKKRAKNRYKHKKDKSGKKRSGEQWRNHIEYLRSKERKRLGLKKYERMKK